MPTTDGQQTKSVHGKWALADNQGLWVPGTLSFQDDEYPVLTLLGRFPVPDDDLQPVVMYGMVEEDAALGISGRVTLLARWFGSLGSERNPIWQRWQSFSSVLGSWQESPEDSKFSFFALETEQLYAWASIGRPKTTRSDQPLAESIAVEPPLPVQWQVPSLGTVSLRWYPQRTTDSWYSSITVTPKLVLESNEPMSVTHAHERFTTPMLQLLSLLTGHVDQVLTKELGRRETELDLGVDHNWIGARWPELTFRSLNKYVDRSLGNWKSTRHEEALVQWMDLVARGDSMALWIAHAEKCQRPLLDFFSANETPLPYAEETFNRVVRSLEAWHRLMSDDTKMPIEDWKAAKLRMKNALSPEDWGLIAPLLARANEMSLKMRLDAVVATAGNAVTLLIERFPRLSSRVRETRDALTHTSSNVDFLTGEAMIYAQRVLEFVMKANLALQIGLSSEYVSAYFRRNSEWLVEVLETGIAGWQSPVLDDMEPHES